MVTMLAESSGGGFGNPRVLGRAAVEADFTPGHLGPAEARDTHGRAP